MQQSQKQGKSEPLANTHTKARCIMTHRTTSPLLELSGISSQKCKASKQGAKQGTVQARCKAHSQTFKLACPHMLRHMVNCARHRARNTRGTKSQTCSRPRSKLKGLPARQAQSPNRNPSDPRTIKVPTPPPTHETYGQDRQIYLRHPHPMRSQLPWFLARLSFKNKQ